MTSRMGGAARGLRLATLITLTSLAGCFSLSRTETPLRHYVLGGSVLADRGTPSAGLAGVTIGVRRLRLASYLEPQYLAVRYGSHEIRYSEFHQWGERLDAGISRAVVTYLTARAPFGAVDVAPWTARSSYDYLIQLQVERFEGVTTADPGAADGAVHVLATWELIRQRDGLLLARGVTDHRQPQWVVGDYVGLVGGLDAGLDILARDLITSLEELERAPPGDV